MGNDVTDRIHYGADGYLRARDPLIDKCHGYTVYGHLTPSHKWYFGITKKPPERRWGLNGQRYKSSPRFYSAIRKYGWSNIYHIIIGTGYTKEEACYLERKLIAEYNALGDGGYNCTAGGDGLHKHKFTNEQIEKMRKSHIGQRSPMSRPVWCVETGQFFDSCEEAGRIYNLTGSRISRAARGERKSCGGYHWQYFDSEPQKIIYKKNVLCRETGDVYPSLTAAATSFGVTPQAIRYAIKNGTRSAGHTFCYIDKVQHNKTKLIGKRYCKSQRTRKHKQARGQQALF